MEGGREVGKEGGEVIWVDITERRYNITTVIKTNLTTLVLLC